MEWWESAKIYILEVNVPNSYEIIWNYSDFIVNMVHNESPKKRHFDLVQLSGQGSRIHPAKGPNTSATRLPAHRLTKWVLPGAGKIRFVRMFRIPEITALQRDPLCETVSLLILDLLVPSCELCRALLADRRPRKSDFTLPTFAAKGEEILSFGVENKKPHSVEATIHSATKRCPKITSLIKWITSQSLVTSPTIQKKLRRVAALEPPWDWLPLVALYPLLDGHFQLCASWLFGT